MRFFVSFLILVRVAVSETLVYPCTENATLTITNKTISTVVSGEGNNGYYYEVWTNSPGGPSNITLYEEDAAFFAQWSMPDDFLGRVGQRWPAPGGVRSGKLYPEYGNMVAEYAYTRSGEKTAGERYNFIGVYGWAYDNDAKGIPLVEYYIIDDWFGNDNYSDTDPIPESTACHDSASDWVCQKGSFHVDDGDYKIYTNWRVEKPSIVGDTTFLQYFSIRQQTRKCGKISISEHFKKWNSLNLRMGVLFEASLLVEVESGNGFVDYTHAKVLLNVSDSDLDASADGTYAPACSDRTPSAGSCVDTRDGTDILTPKCYVQPGNSKCDTSCPIDYVQNTVTGVHKCILNTTYTPAELIAYCSARPVQRSGCKDENYADASCAEFGCGPSCFLNAKHTQCSSECSGGEQAPSGKKYCEVPCSGRTPQPVTPTSSSHSLSNAAVNYDVNIAVEDVVFKFGYKEDAVLKITIDGVTKTSAADATNEKIFPVNEEFNWTGIAQDKLSNIHISVDKGYEIGGGTIDLSDIVFKVDSSAQAVADTFKFFDADPNNHYSTTFTVKYKAAVIVSSTDSSWRCGLPSESPVCYFQENVCVDSCTAPNTADGDGVCVPPAPIIPDPDGSYTHAVRWGGWALCLLIVALFL